MKAPPPGGPSERLKGWVDVVNKGAQIVALVAAGLWGFWLFTRTTEPGLTPRVTVGVELDWAPMASGEDCQADISTTVKNPSVSPAVIDRAKIKIWLYDLSARGNSSGPYFFPADGKPQYACAGLCRSHGWDNGNAAVGVDTQSSTMGTPSTGCVDRINRARTMLVRWFGASRTLFGDRRNFP
jgi:hypothetical protein